MYKFKRVFILSIAFMIIIGSMNTFAMEENEYLPPWLDEYDFRVLLNGDYLEMKIMPEELENGDILIPIRSVLEKAGYSVKWNDDGIIDIKKDSEIIKFDSKSDKYSPKFIQGHVLAELSFFENLKGLSVKYDIPNKTIVMQSDNIRKDQVYSYDLGTRTMRTLLNRDLNYRLNGGIITPETDNNPLVLVMHGAHSFNKAEDNRYDLGYSYLLKELADKGYTALSLNVGIQYSYEDGEPMESERIDHVFEETISQLIKANSGVENNFGIDLKNKIDFNNIVLIGHSRSGQEIFRFAKKYEDDDRFNIKGLLSLAPSMIYIMDYTEIDIPTSIILPELDGDVISLDGQRIFDEMIEDDNKKSEAQLVYLYGANHNGFNQALLKQDQGKSEYKGEIITISPEEQRQFIKSYSTKFLDIVVNDKSLYEELGRETEIFSEYEALVSNYLPGEKSYEAGEGMENIKLSNTQAKEVISSYFLKEKTAGLFNHPGDMEKMDLLNIRWEKKGASIDFKIPKNINTKNKEVLSIYMAQDSTDEINNKENQSFKITLEDSTGRKSSILLDKDNPTLKYEDGEAIYDGESYSSHTPLSIVNIQLDEFKDIDKEDLNKISFNFTETDQGSLMLKFIQFN